MRSHLGRPAALLVLSLTVTALIACAPAVASADPGPHRAVLEVAPDPRPPSLTPLAIDTFRWTPVVDTFVYQRVPNARYDSSARLLAGRDRQGYAYWSLLRFDNTFAPKEPEPYVHDANLRLWLVSGGTGRMLTGLAGQRRIYTDTTWLTKPGVKWLPQLTRNVSGSGRWVTVPLTDQVQTLLIKYRRIDLVISGQYPGAVWSFASRREPYAPHRPRIDVLYSTHRLLTCDSVETTVARGGSEIVTATMTQDLGAPWADTDMTEIHMYAQEESWTHAGRFLWLRDRPADPSLEVTAAPGGGWFAVSKYAGREYVVPHFDRWSVSVSPDKRKRSVTFAWSVTAECPPGDYQLKGEALAVPPGCVATRTVGVWGEGGPEGDRLDLHVTVGSD